MRRRVKTRRARRWGRRFRRRMPKSIPILPTAGLGLSQFSNLGIPSMAPAGPVGNLINNLQGGMDGFQALKWLGRDELLSFTGYDADRGSWDIMNAKGLFVVVGSVLASRFLGRYVNPAFKRIPMIGKYIRL